MSTQWNTVDPQTTWGLEELTFWVVKNLHITLQSTFHTQRSTAKDSTNRGTLVLYVLFKKSAYKWTAAAFAAAAKLCQSCPTLCNPIDGNPIGFSVTGILQARILEWGAISFSDAWKWKVKVKSLSRIRLLATPWTLAYQAPPSMGFSRQEYWSGVPFTSPINGLEQFKPMWFKDHLYH